MGQMDINKTIIRDELERIRKALEHIECQLHIARTERRSRECSGDRCCSCRCCRWIQSHGGYCACPQCCPPRWMQQPNTVSNGPPNWCSTYTAFSPLIDLYMNYMEIN